VFVYRSRFLLRGEVWFDNQPDGRRIDWILYRQRSNPVVKSRWQFFYTRLIDLSRSKEELLAEMAPSTRAKIREAKEEEGTKWVCCNPKDPAVLDRFEQMWNQFAAAKKTPTLNRDWLEKMIEADALEMSAATDSENNLLLYHVSYRDKNRVQQLMAVSPYRSNSDLVTRKKIHGANCFLHWKNMLHFKEQGIRVWDFGGWYTGATDIERLGMNAFKKSFGGEVVREYQCERILTIRGWIVLTAGRILTRCRGHWTSLPPQFIQGRRRNRGTSPAPATPASAVHN